MAEDSEGTDDSEESPRAEAYRRFRRWYHVPVLALVMGYVFWSRFQNYDAFTREGEGVWLQAVDSWYHWRATNWMVENPPSVLGFDPWTGFPDGWTAGQFGTLFDQIVATVALVIGLGNPSESQILLAALVTIPALAALAVIPIYVLGAKMGSRVGGLAGVGLLALFTGQIFVRTTAGQFQHHVAEVFFMSVALLAVVVALRVAERDLPIWEVVLQRDWDALRATTVYSALAGVAITLYLWTWPPAVFFVGILGLFFISQLTVDHYRGRSPDHVAFVGIVSMLVVVAGTAIRVQQSGFSATSLDYLPPALAALVAGGCLFMAWLARQWDARTLPRLGYPVAILVAILATLLVVRVAIPGLFDTLVGNISGRLVWIGHSADALTVQEVAPPENPLSFMRDEYGLAFYTGLAALPVLAFRGIFGGKHRSQYTLVAVWGLVLLSMGLTQIRFNYYLAVGVAVLNAALVGFFLSGISLPETAEDFPEYQVTQVEAYQLLTVAMVLLLVFVPLLPPVASNTPMDLGSQTGPSQDAVKWEESNEWLQENTPAVGNYGGAGNAEQMDYNGRYDRPADGSYDYPDGAYGVMTWWDYGHLVTVQAERIPHANPFQQHARSASAFLTAQNESTAELYLDAIAAGETPTHESDKATLREAVEENPDEPGIQYVMIDDESAMSKFPAITEWTGPDYIDYLSREERSISQNESREVFVGDEYVDTMVANLYLDDARGLEHYRLVHEASEYVIAGFVNNAQASIPVRRLGNATNGSWATVQELGLQRNINLARVFGQALPLGPNQYMYDPYLTSEVKTFERVEGATLAGEIGENATAGNTTIDNLSVSASLSLETGTNRSIQYQQTGEVAADGTFELRVPYPTEETLGPEDGYADSDVLADEPGYEITLEESGAENPVEQAENVSVPELDVQEGGTVAVDLDEFVPDDGEDNGTDNGGENGTENGGENGTENGGENGTENGGENGTENGGENGGNQTDTGNETETTGASARVAGAS